MAVETQQFPVAAVRRIVVMVVVLVVDRQFPQALAFKFTAAVAADPGKQFKGFLPVGFFPLLPGFVNFRKKGIKFFIIG
jgi:hypothetical protein